MREPEERVGRPAGGPAAGRLEGMPAVLRPRRPEDFDAIYAGTPPWEMDHAVQRDAARCWLATITRT